MRFGDFKHQILDEAFTDSDLSNAKAWITHQFAIRGMDLTFDPHFNQRLAARATSDLSLDDLKKVFAEILLKGDIQKAFDKLKNNPNVQSGSRIIDFRLDGVPCSLQINKIGKNKYVADTFYYNDLLAQGARTQEQIQKMTDGTWTLVPTENIGSITDDSLEMLIRRTREPNVPGSERNIHGYNYDTDRLSHYTAGDVFDLVKINATKIIDQMRRQWKKLRFGKQPDPEFNDLGKMLSATVNQLISNKVYGDSRQATALLNNIVTAYERIKQNPNTLLNNSNLQQALEQACFDLQHLTTADIDTEKKLLSSVYKRLAPYALMYVSSVSDGGAAPTSYNIDKKTYDSTLTAVNRNWVDQYGSIIAQVRAFIKDNPQTDNPEVTKLIEQAKSIVQRFATVSDNLKLLTSTPNNSERYAGAPEEYIDPVSGRIAHTDKSRGERERNMAQSRMKYNAQLPIAGWATRFYTEFNNINNVLERYKSPQPDNEESDLLYVLNELNNAYKTGDVGQIRELTALLVSQESNEQSSTYTQKALDETVKRYLTNIASRTIETLEALQSNSEQNVKESANNMNSEIEKHAKSLLMNLANPSHPEYDEWEGEWDNTAKSEYYDPVKNIPSEILDDVKLLAFSKLIQAIKQDPDFIEVVSRNGIWCQWMPKSIYRKLVTIGSDLEELENQARSDMSKDKVQAAQSRDLKNQQAVARESSDAALAEVRKLAGLADSGQIEEADNPKYLGPTAKVKINKQGMQVPLNKKFFGS